MYSFPSTSQILEPAARSTKNGSPPTLRNARTGELMPLGIRFLASAKSLDEREVIGRQKTSNPPTLKASAWQALARPPQRNEGRTFNAQHSKRRRNVLPTSGTLGSDAAPRTSLAGRRRAREGVSEVSEAAYLHGWCNRAGRSLRQCLQYDAWLCR